MHFWRMDEWSPPSVDSLAVLHGHLPPHAQGLRSHRALAPPEQQAVLDLALDKHRGKGQQKVTVEHVYVHAGGQAVVGMVETQGRNRTKSAAGIPNLPETV